MALYEDDPQLRKQRQFLQTLEINIREQNQKIIHERIPKISNADVMALARFVAQARADYLQAGLAIANQGEGQSPADHMAKLKQFREHYKEALEAFASLERAIERGYVELS